MIMFELDRNVAEALLRHAENYEPVSEDPQDDSLLKEALRELHEALLYHLDARVFQGC